MTSRKAPPKSKAVSKQPEEVLQIDYSSSCFTTLAMADRVKSLEISLEALQKQARDMVAKSNVISAEVQQKAVAAVNVKDALFEDLISIEAELSKKANQLLGKGRSSAGRLDYLKDEERRPEEDDIENIPSDIKEARQKILSVTGEISSSKSWLAESYQHLPPVESFELSLDDFWNALSINVDEL